MGCQYLDANDSPAPADGRWEGTPVSCLELFDVRDPKNPTLLTHVMGAGQHTSTCIYDCSYIWGQYGGEVTDLRHIFEPRPPRADHRGTGWTTCPPSRSAVRRTATLPWSFCDLKEGPVPQRVETAPGLMFAACYRCCCSAAP